MHWRWPSIYVYLQQLCLVGPLWCSAHATSVLALLWATTPRLCSATLCDSLDTVCPVIAGAYLHNSISFHSMPVLHSIPLHCPLHSPPPHAAALWRLPPPFPPIGEFHLPHLMWPQNEATNLQPLRGSEQRKLLHLLLRKCLTFLPPPPSCLLPALQMATRSGWQMNHLGRR